MHGWFLLFTNDEVVPSTLVYDLPHPVIVRCGDSVAEEEEDDEVDVVAEVYKHREEGQISVGEIFSQPHLGDSQEQAWNCRATTRLS